MENTVTIILVNYNAQLYMDEFFESVHVQDYSSIEIVMVDNGSTDSSISWLKENAPEVHLIEMQENVGFGEGCNLGMRYAIEELGAEYVLLLNIDTVIQPNLISELQKYADENTVTTAQIYCGEKGTDLEPWYAGGVIDENTAKTNQILYASSEMKTYEVGFISGCCMMIHKKVVEKVGYFDSQYFLYYEDTDYCVRMQKAGITMRYITTTSLWHKVGGSSLGGSEMSCSTQYYVIRNRLLFADKYSEKFPAGNLSILRKILEEFAFFDGINNAKYRVYVQAAIADHLKGYYGKGYYGKSLLEKGYYISNGFFEREDNGADYWYWASERSTTIYLVNPRRQSGIYMVSFDLAPAVVGKRQLLEVIINGKDAAEYAMPGHVEFMVPIGGESVIRLDMIFHGTEKTDVVDGNKRTLFYQMLNLGVIESGMNYCVMGKIYPREQDEQDSWQWVASKACKIYIVNRELLKKAYTFRTAIENVDKSKYNLRITNQGKNLATAKTMGECCFPVTLRANEILELEMQCDAPSVFDYGRRVCFKLKNVVFEKTEDEIFYGSEFYALEINESSQWSWCASNCGTFRIVNQESNVQWKTVEFSIQPFNREKSGKIRIYQNGTDISEQCEYEGQIRVLMRLEPQEMTEFVIATEYPVVRDGEREICFCLANIRVRAFEENIFWGSTFGALEYDGVNAWSWNKDKSGRMSVINRQEVSALYAMELEVIPFDIGTKSQDGTVVLGESTEQLELGSRKRFFLEVSPNECVPVTIKTLLPICELAGQNYCFQVRNINLEMLQSGLYFDDQFYMEESDSLNYWRWCSEKHGKVVIVNTENAVAKATLDFAVMVPDRAETEFEVWYEGKQLLQGVSGPKYSLCITCAAHKMEEVEFICHADRKCIGGRTLCFGIHNLCYTPVALL